MEEAAMRGAGAGPPVLLHRAAPKMRQRRCRGRATGIGETTGACRWWLRTTGARKMDMWGVRVDGRLTAYGMQDVDWPTNTVRPVFWMDYSK